MALDRALSNLMRAVRELTGAVLAAGTGAVSARLQTWHQARAREIDRIAAMVADLIEGDLTVSRLSVAAGLLSDLLKGAAPPAESRPQPVVAAETAETADVPPEPAEELDAVERPGADPGETDDGSATPMAEVEAVGDDSGDPVVEAEKEVPPGEPGG